MKTLRGQFTAWFIALITVIGVAGSIGTGWVSLNEEGGFLDDQLRQIALSVGDTPSAAGESSHIIAGANPDDHIIVHILDNKLNTIRNSDPAIAIPVETATGFYDHVNAGIQWRTFTLIAENRVVQVSQQAELRTAAAISSMLNTVLPIALLIPLSWLLVGWLVKRLLKPLQRLTAVILARQTGSNVNLSPVGIPGEVVPVVEAMNKLLVRQHELLEFRQQFISDAAHQLRTPLTALTLQMENLKAALRGKAGSVHLQPMQYGFSRMSGLLDQLLKLAQADELHLPLEMEIVDLNEIVRAGLADVYALAAAKSIDLGIVADAVVKIPGVQHDLIMLLGNLLDNAIRYTPNSGKVDVEIYAHGNEVGVIVSDNGPGIPESSLPFVFNRFYRCNPTGGDGSGLGLAIVAALAARNQAEVAVQNRTDGSGLTAKLRFKLA